MIHSDIHDLHCWETCEKIYHIFRLQRNTLKQLGSIEEELEGDLGWIEKIVEKKRSKIIRVSYCQFFRAIMSISIII